MKNASPFRVGIVGGMGPMAGVHLQKLIIEATPARRDQDHLQVVCFTNPQIPDRTASLLGEDRGESYVRAVQASAGILAAAGVHTIVLPCHTAHARLADIQAGVSVPILDMVALTIRSIEETYPTGSPVALLATDGTLQTRIYQTAGPNIRWIIPDARLQASVMRSIYGIKAGALSMVRPQLLRLMTRMRTSGAEAIVCACTELSLCADDARDAGIPLIDPLDIVARELVRLAAASPSLGDVPLSARQSLAPSAS